MRERNEKLESLEQMAANRQRDLARDIAKMVQKEFWNKVEKVALLFHEKREEKERKKQMSEDLNDMMSKTEIFSKTLAQQVIRDRHNSGSSSSHPVSRSESRVGTDSEEEYDSQHDAQSDNESTIESDEDVNEEDELDDLNKNNDADITEILEKLYGLKAEFTNIFSYFSNLDKKIPFKYYFSVNSSIFLDFVIVTISLEKWL